MANSADYSCLLFVLYPDIFNASSFAIHRTLFLEIFLLFHDFRGIHLLNDQNMKRKEAAEIHKKYSLACYPIGKGTFMCKPLSCPPVLMAIKI